MFPKIRWLLFFALLFTSCHTHKKLGKAQPSLNFTSITNVRSLYLPKVVLRINADGYLRTHKANITYLADSIISINILASSHRQVAHIIFDSEGLNFYDNYSAVGYQYSFEYLTKSITYPINFFLVRDIIFGFSPTICGDSVSNFEFTFSEYQKHNPSESHISLKKNDNDIPVLVEISTARPIFKLALGPISPLTLHLPEYLTLFLNFNGKDLEFELEYIFHKISVNKEVNINFDTSIPLKPVAE